MLVADFDFDLPPDLIAQSPASPRDEARLLHVPHNTNLALADLRVTDLASLLNPGDIMVFNNTKVIPSRLLGRRRNAQVEVTLHKEKEPGAWWAFARPAKKLNDGDEIEFAGDFSCYVRGKRDGGEVLLQFDDAPTLRAGLDAHGIMPLPPYIKRPKSGDAIDRTDYQTIYAEHEGAVAAPTAGLHFTERVMADLAQMGVETAFVTLHVGAGTFLPIKVDDTDDHHMHAEWGEISGQTARAVNQARKKGGRVVAVGSTSLRLLETAADESGKLNGFTGETDIFMTPGYDFKIADCMFTNFHLPKSTLFMLVSAFAGTGRMKAAYAHAIAEKYRFFSYGDSCFLEKES